MAASAIVPETSAFGRGATTLATGATRTRHAPGANRRHGNTEFSAGTVIRPALPGGIVPMSTHAVPKRRNCTRTAVPCARTTAVDDGGNSGALPSGVHGAPGGTVTGSTRIGASVAISASGFVDTVPLGTPWAEVSSR
jgi:hypothetical protein